VVFCVISNAMMRCDYKSEIMSTDNTYKSDLDWIKEELELRTRALADSEYLTDKILADMINLQEIDWDELVESLAKEEEEEVA